MAEMTWKRSLIKYDNYTLSFWYMHIYIYIPIFLVLILLKDFILRLSIQVLSALCVWCGLLYFAFGNSVRAC